jgi:hypothetical protein
MRMTESELLDLFRREPEIVLAFDTNAIFGNRRGDPFLELCDSINQLNRIRQPRLIRKVISAPVYMEKLHDLRQAFPSYEHERILQTLDVKGIEVTPVLRHHAEHIAEILGKQYPGSKAWRDFKRQRCLSCLRLPDDLAHKATGSGKRCGATVDWLVAGHADAEGHVLVTNDRGPEFDSIRRKARLKTVVKVVDEVLRATGAPP